MGIQISGQYNDRRRELVPQLNYILVWKKYKNYKELNKVLKKAVNK